MRSPVAATTGSGKGGCFLVLITVVAALFVANVDASDKSALVVGVVKCSECTQKQHEASPYQGALVGVQCKTSKGEVHESGVSRIDDNGSFKIKVPQYLINDKGELAGECHAKLLSSYALKPCSTNEDGDMSSKLVLQTKSKESDSDVETIIFGTSTDLSLSSSTCPSVFSPLKLLLKPLHPLPKLPPKPKLKPLPKFKLPPKPKLKPLPKFKLPPKPKLKPLPPLPKPKLPPKPKLKPLPPLPKFKLPPKPKLKPLPPLHKPKLPPKPILKPLPPLPKLPPKPILKPLPPLPKLPPKPVLKPLPPKPVLKPLLPPKPILKPLPPFPLKPLPPFP